MNQQEKRLTECRDQEKDLSGCQEREMETSQIEKDCLVYFRSNPVWKRLLRGFWEKYRSYGAFSGSVILRGLAEDEVGELEGFFGLKNENFLQKVFMGKRVYPYPPHVFRMRRQTADLRRFRRSGY